MKKYLYYIFIASAFFTSKGNAQTKTKNLVIVTLDGMRWQEVFGGADSEILKNKEFTRDSAGTFSKFWDDDIDKRREKLFPFLWRWKGNKVNNANRYKFSYPGYNEIFTGYPDTAINSNDKIPNKNINVLDFLNKQPNFKNKIAAFSSWDAFPYE